jgi:DNA invertase Pin-like site-specific DNA recombinase
VLNVMASVSQWEREAIGERTRDALRHKKAQGQRVGTVPFGYRLAADGESLEPEEREAAILDTIRDCRRAGFSLQATADVLNARGHRTRKGSAWQVRTVHHLAQQQEAA